MVHLRLVVWLRDLAAGEVVLVKVEFHPGKGAQRYYLIDGEREVDGVPIKSVTEILKVIGDRFGPAAWWGMKTGVEGYHKLLAEEKLPRALLTSDNVVTALTAHKLTVNHVRDSAGDRGTSVHKSAENWANTGELTDLALVPVAERGYHEALLSFVNTEEPTPLAAEVMVGSRELAYAGTFDLYAPGDLWDYKTSKSVYPQMHLQLTAYEMARREMGLEPTDFQAIVHLKPDGTYEVVENKATEDQWRSCVAAYRALKELEGSLKKKKVAV